MIPEIKHRIAKIRHGNVPGGYKKTKAGIITRDTFQEMGSKVEYFDGVKTWFDQWPKFAVNYTAKTQFLFRINKGVLTIDSKAQTN